MPPRKRVEGKRAASDTSPREGQYIQPVRPSTAKSRSDRRDSTPRHAAPEDPAPPKTPRKTAAKKAAPKAAPKSSPPAAPTGGVVARKHRRAAALHAEARDYANRQAYKATTGKPSIVGRTVAGGVAGAAAGTAFGPVGTGVGAAVGGAGGAVGGARAKKAYKMATRGSSGAKRIIVAEFAVCVVVAALSPMTDSKRDEPPSRWMKRMTAIMGVFFVLGLISAGGRGAARAAAGFGGIVTVALVVSERNLFVKLASVFSAGGGTPAVGTGPTSPPAGERSPERSGVGRTRGD